MASVPERSLYRKIQVVLDESRKGNYSSIEEIVEHIYNRAPLNFTYFKIQTPGKAVVHVCSKETIEQVVDICIDLGLIEKKNARLTATGIRGADRNLFDTVLRRQLKANLVRMGFPIEKIHEAIFNIFSSPNEKKVPTWDEICINLGVEDAKSKKKFHQYLTLLSLCKGIDYSQRKIYLPGQPSRSEK